MRLGFVSARAANHDGCQLHADVGLGRVVAELSRITDGALTCASVNKPEDMSRFDCSINFPADSYMPLPRLPGFSGSLLRGGDCRKIIRAVEERSDVVIVQMPFLAPTALLGAKKPRLYHVYGDVFEMARASGGYTGIKRQVALAAGFGIDRMQRWLFNRDSTAVVTNGREMLERYAPRNGRVVLSSSYYLNEVASVARSRPVGAPFRVLFVGYLRPEKGIDTLIAGYDKLLDEYPEAELRVIGGTADAGGVSPSIRKALAAVKERGRIEFLGHMNFGSQLFEQFANADVLVLPSRSEGTPRVLLEARAFGCPVIASRVGGIPTSVTDGVDGVLVPPGDVDALAEAMVSLAADPDYRSELALAGMETARGASVEVFSRTLAEQAAALLN